MEHYSVILLNVTQIPSLYLGCIIYVTGGTNLVRRWQRNLAAYCPQMQAKKPVDVLALQRELAGTIPHGAICWEYQLLYLWVEQQKITTKQASKMIRSVIAEVLFDVIQAINITYQINRYNALSARLILIDADQVIAEANQSFLVFIIPQS